MPIFIVYKIGFVLKFIFFFIFTQFLFPQETPEEETVVLLAPKQFANIIKNKKTVLDLRKKNLYYLGHISGVTHLDAKKRDFNYQLLKYDRSKTFFIYDHYGVKSRVIANTMKQLGFKKIYVLKGGFITWKENKLPFSVHMQYLVDSIGHKFTNDSTTNELPCNCTYERH
jgi:rhodanese-related sulfurtransferase